MRWRWSGCGRPVAVAEAKLETLRRVEHCLYNLRGRPCVIDRASWRAERESVSPESSRVLTVAGIALRDDARALT